MVGNLIEWVGDWIQGNEDLDNGFESTSLYGMDGIFGIDETNEVERLPAALIRGGFYFSSSEAGVFALDARFGPSIAVGEIGFRCARNRRGLRCRDDLLGRLYLMNIVDGRGTLIRFYRRVPERLG